MFLIIVIIVGTLINLWTLSVAISRKVCVGTGTGSVKDEIARLTMNRAMRLEFLMFVAQLSRLIYAIMFFAPDCVYFSSIFETCFLTILLDVIAVWDLVDRHRISAKLEILYK